MMYRFFLITLLAVLLVGCASTNTKPNATAKKMPPASLMMPCKDLPQFKSDSSDTSDLVGYNISLIQAYGRCSLKLKKLQAWVSANS